MQPADRQSMISILQALYYLPTGIWPLVSLRTFMAVTGPKVDGWLVKTVGALITVVGGVLMLAGLRRRVSPEVRLLAVGSAAGLAAIDVVYVARRRISPIYLLDALGEVILIGAWVAAMRTDRRGRGRGVRRQLARIRRKKMRAVRA
ncbi:hypothetical protein [Sphaerobacter thermophilus]|jgi:hypothetical protein|uniref:DUF4345 domain-containing protein n=1 Tax=Sphaerobacter thermophilus (strain ATCC 49802 / DSM 20745 / KCCM 41009 / NCIMB 13125 / S 6022) TaxID=479434 RepID=D1C408_SPHTD|nr:hypothetical protein [Sphaerobacter thermophilus]ACZ38975.1 conserved hypothetical protein [Sphaerobacter thermophilus DSM 20745]